METFGAPNITTRDSSGNEVWTYQRQAQISQSSSSSGFIFVIIAGKSSEASGFETSSKMMTLIIKFDGNDIVIKVWDSSLDYEHSSDPSYIQGNGTYGQILTVIDVLDAYVYGCTDPEALNFNEYANMDDGSCDYTIEQSIDLLSYQLNNISFNS